MFILHLRKELFFDNTNAYMHFFQQQQRRVNMHLKRDSVWMKNIVHFHVNNRYGSMHVSTRMHFDDDGNRVVKYFNVSHVKIETLSQSLS